MRQVLLITALLPLIVVSPALAQLPPDLNARVLQFMAEKGVPPIVIKPGVRLQKDFDDRWLAWADRAMVAPFAEVAGRWPALQQDAVTYVRDALRYWKTGRHPLYTVDKLAERGNTLKKAGVDDPLFLTLATWAETRKLQRWPEPSPNYVRAVMHPEFKKHPACTQAFICGVYNGIRVDNKSKLNFLDQWMDAARKALVEDAAYRPEEDDIAAFNLEFLWNRMNEVFCDEIRTKQEPRLTAIAEGPFPTEWLRLLVQGGIELARSEPFGDGAGSVSRGQELLQRAWELHPERPEAAVLLIRPRVGGDPEPESRLWFERAISARFDCMPAYSWMFETYAASGDGRNGAMAAFLLSAVQTGRYDTDVPAYFLRGMNIIARQLDDWRRPYRSGLFSEVIVELTRKLAEDPARSWEPNAVKGDHGVYLWMAGQYAMAHDLLKDVPEPYPSSTRRILMYFPGSREREVRAESVIRARGRGDLWELAKKDYDAMRFDPAEAALQCLSAELAGETPIEVKSMLSAIQIEKALGRGGWVELKVDPQLTGWRVHKGNWSATPDGVLVNRGADESIFILHGARVGDSLEMEGEFEFEARDKGKGRLGMVVGHAWTDSREQWVTCSLSYDDNAPYHGTLLWGNYLSRAPKVVIDTPPVRWRFHVLCQNGLVNFRLNDKEILKNHQPIRTFGDAFGLMKDGRVGFNARLSPEGMTTRIYNVRVRRLGVTP